jgi:hypothetical protein
VRRRWPAPAPLARAGLIVAAGVLLAGAALWAGSLGPWIGRPHTASAPADLPSIAPPTFTPPPVRNVDPAAAAPGAGSFDPTVVLLVLGGILLVAVVLIAASMVRNRTAPAASRKRAVEPADDVRPTPVAPDPARAFDPREAADYVIACWDQLERQAAARGTGRRPEQTPTEFIQALRSFGPVDERAAAELLSLYQRARFDHVRLLPDTAIRARAGADALLAALGAGAVQGYR